MGNVSLTERTVSGFLWLFGGAAAQAAIKTLVLAALARMLAPADFGLANAAAVVVALCDIFAQLGVAPALVQREQIDERDVATAWVASVLLGIGCGFSCYLA